MNGRRVLTKFNAQNAANEIIGKWKNLNVEETEKYMDSNFEAVWDKFDVFKTGYIDNRNAYYWVRTLAGEEYYSG